MNIGKVFTGLTELVLGTIVELTLCVLWVCTLRWALDAAVAEESVVVYAVMLALWTACLAIAFMRHGYFAALLLHPKRPTITEADLDRFVRYIRTQAGDSDPTSKQVTVDQPFLVSLVKHSLITFTVFDPTLPRADLEGGEEQQT